MKLSTKWLIGIAAAAVLLLLLYLYSSEFRIWIMEKLVTLFIWLIIFASRYRLPGVFNIHKIPGFYQMPSRHFCIFFVSLSGIMKIKSIIYIIFPIRNKISYPGIWRPVK